MKSSLVIPAYNEEEGLPKVIAEAIGFVDEIVVVDDGSTDSTYASTRSYDVRIVRHKRNLGKPQAIKTGVGVTSGDVVILMDADFTYPALKIPEFLKEMKSGADLVLGSRFLGSIREMPFLNVLGNKFASMAVGTISEITDPQTGFRAFKKESFDALDVEAEGLEYELKMTIKALKMELKIIEIPIGYRKRIGTSKLGFRDILRMTRSLTDAF